MPEGLQIFTLGGLRLRLDGERLDGLSARKAKALLVYLAAQRRALPREVLAEMFWSDRGLTRSLSNLRVALTDLRKHLEPYLVIDRETVALDSESGVWLDAVIIETELEAAGGLERRGVELTPEAVEQIEAAVARYKGEFLHGFFLREARDFDEWVTVERERLQKMVLDSLGKLVEWYLYQGEYPAGIDHAQRWLQLDPFQEKAQRQLMRLLAYSGQQAAALSEYETFAALLEEEIGVEPLEETRELYEAIKEQRLSPPEKELAGLEKEETSPPFKGLQYFDVEDADLFFGREGLTAELIGRLHKQNLLAVVGASGSGKSSLVRAGVVPALMRGEPLADGSLPPSGSSRWPIHIITPTSHPLEALAASLTQDVESVTATATLIDDLASDPRSLHLSVRKTLAGASGDRLLLVVDQFEELFTQCRDESERRAFIDNLLTAVSEETVGPTIVLITLRADFYAQCAQYDDLRRALEDQQAYIGQMNLAELRRAIEEPARRRGCTFEPGLVDLMLADIGAEGDQQPEPGALPLLSHSLLETWKRREGRTLTLAGYMDAGGVRGAIAATAERVYNQQLNEEQQTIARKIFLRLTELGEGTQDTRRRIRVEELVPSSEGSLVIEVVLRKLVDARLITAAKGTLEVAHEALIREWPRLRAWLEEDREGLRLHRQLTESAQNWLELDRDPGSLYRGARLAQASEWAEGHAEELNSLEREFLEASLSFERQEEAEREAQRQRELEAARALAESEKQRAEIEQRRAEEQTRAAEEQARAAEQLRRRRRYLLGSLVAASVLAVVALFFGFRSRQSAAVAERQNRLALARELAVHSVDQLTGDSELSLLLAVEAINLTRQVDQITTPEADVALYRALTNLTSRGVMTGHTSLIDTTIFSPDGSRLVTAGEEEEGVHLWDGDGRRITTMVVAGYEGHFTYSASFSPDGKYILTSHSDRTAFLWDADGNLITRLEGHGPGRILKASFSPDGERIVTASEDGTARLWDLEGNLIGILEGHTDRVVWASFSPDGEYIITAGFDTSRLWDMDGNPIATLEGQSLRGDGASFSPDSGCVLTTGHDGTQRLWDVEGNLINTLKGHTDRVKLPIFSPDGKTILTASFDGTARLWDADGNYITVLEGHTDAINQANFSPDGKRIVTASDDGTARLWDSQGNPIATIRGHTAPVGAANFSPDGKLIVTGSADGTARLWELEGSLLSNLIGHGDAIQSITYGPGGERILTASKDGTARLWDTNGQLLSTLEGHTRTVWSADFNHDGTRILTASEDGTAWLWDLRGEALALLDNQGWAVRQAVFSPDGEHILTASDDGTPRLWESDGTLLAELEGHLGAVRLVRFSPDGERFVTAGYDFNARFWDVEGTFLAPLSGHSGRITSLVFSADGERILTASEDGTARLWDRDGNLQLVLEGHTESVNSANFNPEGTRIVTASSDGTA
ncbi:MAG: BTAD domain-containing putative transcriptional regulator, partial [Anaerolineales bacterium]